MPLAEGQAFGQQPYVQQQQSQQDGPSFGPAFQSHTFQQLQDSEAVFQQFQRLSMQQRQQPQQAAYQSPVATSLSGPMPQAAAAAGMPSPITIISNQQQQQQQQIMGGVHPYPASYAGSPALNSGQTLSQTYSPVAPQLQRHGSAPLMLDGYIANLGPAQQQQQQQQSSQAQQQVYCAGDGGMQVAWIPVAAGSGGVAAQGPMGTPAATYQQSQQQQQQVVYAQQPQQLQQNVVLQQQQQQPHQQQKLLQYNPSQQSYVTIPVQRSQQAVQYQQQQVQVSACSLQEPMLIQTSECFFADSDGADLRVQSGGQGVLSQGSGTMYVSQGSQLQSGFHRA